jgi:hypothetical protein
MAAILPIIAAIAGIGSAGVGVGSAIYNDVNKPSTPTMPTLPPANVLSPTQVQQASQQAGGASANAQANTGQGLSPSAQAALVDQLYGTPG